MADEVRPLYTVRRALPGVEAEGTSAVARVSRRGEQVTQVLGKGAYAMADEGQYFIATNPTPGTAIAGITAADGLDDTEALMVVQNDATDGTRIYLDYLRLLVKVAGTNGTNVLYASKIDNVERVTSGGSSITPVNVNMDATATSNADIQFGAIVSPAASSDVRLLSHGQLRSVIAVVGDTYTFDFGAGAHKVPAGLATAGTAQCHLLVPHCPVVIGPGDSWVLHINAASQTVASQFEFELGYWER